MGPFSVIKRTRRLLPLACNFHDHTLTLFSAFEMWRGIKCCSCASHLFAGNHSAPVTARLETKLIWFITQVRPK